MKTGLIIAVLFLSSVGMAQTVSTKGESLDKVQVLALLAGGVPNARVASLVVERGITFTPTDGYIQLLQKAKADEGVITAVRVATHPPAHHQAKSVSSGGGPLKRDQLLDLLQTGVGSDVLANLVAKRGINFEPFDEYLGVYALAGAQESLLSVLRQAAPAQPEVAAPTVPSQTEGELPAAGRIRPKRIRVSGEVESARLLFQPPPAYPPVAKAARIHGRVRLQALIAKDGTIEDLKVVSGHPLLAKAALDAVSKWRYQPTLLNGKPMEVETEIDVVFTLKI